MNGQRVGHLDINDWVYIVILFVISRIVLTVIGYFAHIYLWHKTPVTLDDFANIWNVWDGRLYVDIAQNGYSAKPFNTAGMANYAFFPLYPILIRLVEFFIHNYAISGLIISNIALLVSCYYIYKYVSLDFDTDKATARRAVKYIILFPTAFLFSAVLTESLFVALSIACLYYARKGNWPVAGALGFFVAITRLPGLAIIAPLGYEYFRQHVFWSGRVPDFRRLFNPSILMLLLPPLGLGLWAAYNHHLTGDTLGFIHVQAAWGGGHLVFPLIELVASLHRYSAYVVTGAIFNLAALLIMILFYKKVDFGAWIYGILLICIPLCSKGSAYSMLRYLVVVFPLCILMAKVSKNKRIDILLSVTLIMLQIIFMALWTTWSNLIV